jgi:hypothetical protein
VIPKTGRVVSGGSGALVVLLLLGGCAGQGSGEAENAENTAIEFSMAIDSSTAVACGLLAPQTLEDLEDVEGACAGSLPDELESAGGPAESVEVYGKDAIVRLATDTIFLARFPRGWRVTAAGCTRQQAGRPYDCKVKAA